MRGVATTLSFLCLVHLACSDDDRKRSPRPDGGRDTSTIDGALGNADGAEPCEALSSRCVDGTTLRVCGADGRGFDNVDCSRGCDSATTPNACVSENLSGWTLHQFQTTDDTGYPDANYDYSTDGIIATQTVNANPSVLYNAADLRNVRVQGQFQVATANDDDLIGFVFGWQDSSHFYLLDWKETTQPSTPCGTAEIGVTLKKVESASEPESCVDFWASAGSSNVTILAATSANPVGWQSSVSYTLQLDFRPGDFKIVIWETESGNVVARLAVAGDRTYPQGKFGFYNYSQEQVRYESFSVATLAQ